MKSRILSVVVLAATLYACSPKVAPAPSAPPTPPKALSAELAEGKNLYENNCAKCHKLYDRREFTPEEWQPITLRMQKKAKITDAEREKIYNYLTMN